MARLPRPSVAAWAVNQLVRTQGRSLSELFSAGEALRAAQRDILRGRGDAAGLRAAAERERAAVEELTRAARGLVRREGHGLSGAIIERVADTLHAAALDEHAQALVRDGRLERELRHAGLGTLGEASIAPADADAKAAAPEAARAAQAEAAHKATQATQATQAVARRRAERAERALALAQERRDRAARGLREADEALVSARAENEAAAEAHRQAQERPAG